MRPEELAEPIEETPIRRLKVMTAGEVLSANLGAPRWIWEGWIPRSKVGMLAAVSDHGKTALMLQIAAGVAMARPAFGIPTTATPCGVLFYSLEDDPEDFQPRLRWVLEGMEACGELTAEDRANLARNLRFVSPTYEVADLRFEKTAAEIRYHLSLMREEGIEPALVVVETLSAVTEGDESQANTTRTLWASARQIANHEDVTTLITHHYRKESGSGKGNRSSMVERIEPDKVRGSSANEGAARFVLQMGLPTKDEAEGAGLDGFKALNKGYAVLRASKLKAHKPDMIFVERIDKGERGQHTWTRHPKGDAIIANLLSSATRKRELNREDQVLMELFRQGTNVDREALKAIFSEAKDAERALTNALYALRKKGDVQSRKCELTAQGYERGRTLVEEADEASELIGTPWGLDSIAPLAQEKPQEMTEIREEMEPKPSLSSLPSLRVTREEGVETGPDPSLSSLPPLRVTRQERDEPKRRKLPKTETPQPSLFDEPMPLAAVSGDCFEMDL